ncbi:MAG: hypothetical protein P1S60_02635 [Anaerolineae bacterium]|nr:hypothetical protein [Anaerolineae bacterium]
MFELNVGETAQLTVQGKSYTLELLSVHHDWEPDDWIKNNPSYLTLREARVETSIHGNTVVIRANR